MTSAPPARPRIAPRAPSRRGADPASGYCAIDFGTSNSAVALTDAQGRTHLVELEPGHVTMPTAVFYYADGPEVDGPPRSFGRAAVAAYVEGHDGRLMRSMKSILGSDLVDQRTDVGGGRAVKYLDVVAGYLKRLRGLGQAALDAHGATASLDRVVLGRPVYFVDDDPRRDARAQAALESAAHAVGFKEVQFQFEPIAAAFDYERQTTDEELVLVADIGGGTSDFSVVRVGPERAKRIERKGDILANHGVHIAGTDFDRHVELASVLRAMGYRSVGPAGPPGTPAPREVPSAVYFDLATWHLINTVYAPQRVADLRRLKSWYADPRQHERLMRVLDERLGHELAARAEQAKIAVSGGEDTRIDLDIVEAGLSLPLAERDAVQALDADLQRIVEAARVTVTQAGIAPPRVDAVYFTGGSTGLRLLADRIAEEFPRARAVRGDRFASVATGLGLHARRLYGR